jgi:hypothetical protein
LIEEIGRLKHSMHEVASDRLFANFKTHKNIAIFTGDCAVPMKGG